ncbi:alpha/beta hydrolase [Cnuella takakiae]|uniref:alpha/beta hydrolase n=1 Tax=Cnuella takakiae TaxID=1302690 RepID=UPI001FE2B8AC|nr:alpha/beta hydrolase-fold protein [Cnuella takakiae]
MTTNYLRRSVVVDIYDPAPPAGTAPCLLLLNDGQDLHQFQFQQMLQALFRSGSIHPVICVGIHAGPERLQEYGIGATPDYAGRGALAGAYQNFILSELLPFLYHQLAIPHFARIAFAGFSLGGLSAFDTVWQHPQVFQVAGAFSGSFWWRSRDLDDGYNDDQHRIMHQKVRSGQYHPGQRFYFTTGSLDESADRNGNGIIDSIDDTTDLVKELQAKGYKNTTDIQYLNYEDGSHDVATWGRVMPAFLEWAFKLL